MKPDRPLALLVRYWAANMTMIHDRENNWPGFGYTEPEKVELRAMARRIPHGEFYAFMGLNTVIAIAIFAVIVVAGMNCLLAAIGGEQNMPNTPASLFFLSLALEAVLSLTVGLPAAMTVSAAIIGRWYRVADAELPDRNTTAKYFHKLWFQIARMAIVMTAVVLPMWIFVPSDSKFMVVVRLIVPFLAPLVTALSTGYYFSTRLRS